MAGPGDEVAAGAGGGGHLRASHADREQVIDMLKAAFVQGRLAKDEFDLRVGQALVSRTYADLAALTADIPARPGGAKPREPTQKPVGKKAVAAAACATGALVGMMAGATQLPDGNPFTPFVAMVVIVLLMTVPTAWLLLFHTWLDKRTGRQAPQGRG